MGHIKLYLKEIGYEVVEWFHPPQERVQLRFLWSR